jgi:hypothetical protein
VKPKVNIIVMVDAVGALSDRTLHNGNLTLVDDSTAGSRHQGTPDLVTAVLPGQVVHWTPVHVDVQTPVEIESIEFLPAETPPGGPDQPPAPQAESAGGEWPGASGYAPAPAESTDTNGADGHHNLDTLVWEGTVPYYLLPGVPYRYRLSIKIHEGPNSVLRIDSPALLRV